MTKMKRNIIVTFAFILVFTLLCICLTACAPKNGTYTSYSNNNCKIIIQSSSKCKIETLHGEGNDPDNTIDMYEMYQKTEFSYKHNNKDTGWISVKNGYALEVTYNNDAETITHMGWTYSLK